MIDGILGIDVSKDTLDVSMSSCSKVRTRRFANSPDGWRHLLDWLDTQKVRQVHACLESTGRYSVGIACAMVSIVNPAQIRDFTRTKLGRNKQTWPMRLTFASFANCSNPSLGHHLRRPVAGWVSCRRFEQAWLRV